MAEVIYYDKEGNAKTGYEKNGITYQDDKGTKRVENGSLVKNGGNMYVMTDSGGILYSDFLTSGTKQPQGLIGDYQAALSNAAQMRTESALADLEAHLPEITRAYDVAARGANVQHEQILRALANQLAATGLYNSGYSDTEISRQAAALGQSLSGIETARLGAYEDIERQKAAARLGGQGELAEIAAMAAQLGLSQYNADRAFDYQRERDSAADQKWERELALRAGNLQGGKTAVGTKGVADPLEVENGVQVARKFIGMYGNTLSADRALEMMRSERDYLVEKLGEGGYNAYVETVLANYPGMSAAGNATIGGTASGGGTAKGSGKDTPEALYELVFGAKSAARFQKNGRLGLSISCS